jgi:hypothetical protein
MPGEYQLTNYMNPPGNAINLMASYPGASAYIPGESILISGLSGAGDMIRFIKSFFYSHGRPAPVYFWATVFCSLAAIMLVLKCAGSKYLSDTLILGIFGFVLGWIALYNYRKNGEKHDS